MPTMLKDTDHESLKSHPGAHDAGQFLPDPDFDRPCMTIGDIQHTEEGDNDDFVGEIKQTI